MKKILIAAMLAAFAVATVAPAFIADQAMAQDKKKDEKKEEKKDKK